MALLKINCLEKGAYVGGLRLPCRIGKAGFTPYKNGREGDQKTPLGDYTLRWGFYRADRLTPPSINEESPLTWRTLQDNDGWCDAADYSAYNRFIKLPSAQSHEALWREDGAYDILLIMSHNDSPPKHNLGSAVFIHVAQPDDRQTLGCIAFAPEDMVKLLPHLQAGMNISIQP